MFLRTSRDDRFRLESINEIRQKNGLSLLRHIDCIEDFFYYAWQGTIDRTRNLDKTANGLMVSIFLPAYQKTVMQISHMIHEAANNKNNPKLIQSFFVDQLYENYFDAKYFSLSNEPYWSTTRDEDQRSNEIYRAKKQSESEEAFKMEFLNSQQQWIMNALGKSFPQETKAQVIPRDFATLFAIASENIFS